MSAGWTPPRRRCGTATGTCATPSSAWARRRWSVSTSYRLETDLTPEKIQESFASPQTLSFWDLPTFIDALEATGFSSVPQRLYYNALLAQPLLLSAMVLFAAAFALRQTRRGGTLTMAVGGVAAGFFIFVMTDVVMALGLSESIPVGMAAWMPRRRQPPHRHGDPAPPGGRVASPTICICHQSAL